MVEKLNLNKITNELKEYFPLLEITNNDNKIILKGDNDDFEFFMEELNEILPEECFYKNKLTVDNHNTCEITISKK